MRARVLMASIAALTVIVPGIAAGAVSEPELVSHDDAGTVRNGYDASVSDDGSRVAYVTYMGSGQNNVIHVLDPSTGKNIFSQAIAPDAPMRVDLSGDGQSLVTGTADGEVTLYDVDTGTGRPLPETFASVGVPHIATDGRWVSFPGRRTSSSAEQAYRWNVAAGTITQVTTGGAVRSTVISGDGGTVAYDVGGHTYARRVGTGSYIRVDALPGGPAFDGTSRPTGISASGNYVLFSSNSIMGSIPDNCRGYEASCVWRKKLIDDKQLLLANKVDGKVAPARSPEATSDLSADGRVAAYATVRGYVRAYRFSTATNVHVSLNSDGGLRPVYAVSTTQTGSAVAYSLSDDDQTVRPTTWITESGI